MPSAVSVAGNACLTVGMIMIGPSPFSHIVPTVDLMIGMSAIVGVGYSAVMVSTFARGYNMAMEKGYDDDMDSYLAISGQHLVRFQSKVYFSKPRCFRSLDCRVFLGLVRGLDGIRLPGAVLRLPYVRHYLWHDQPLHDAGRHVGVGQGQMLLALKAERK